MYIYICIYIYTYIYTYIHTSILMHTHTHAHTDTRTHTHTYHVYHQTRCCCVLVCACMRLHIHKRYLYAQSRPTHKQKTTMYPKDKTYSQNRPISTFACVFVRSRKSSGFCEQTCECSKTACAIFRQTCTWTQTHRQTQTVMLE